MSIKYKILILITFLITVINIKADGISTTLDTISIQTKESINYVDTSSNFKHLYNDIRTSIVTLASGLKVGTEHVYKVLIKQQIVYSISWIIILIIVIIFTNIFKKAYLYTKENWEEEVFVPFTFLGIITLTILYIIVFCNIEGMITGLINPEYGAIKDIINFIKK